MLLHTTAHSVYLHVQMTPGSSKVSSINMTPIRLLLIQYSAVWLLEMADYTGLSILCTSPFKKMFA